MICGKRALSLCTVLAWTASTAVVSAQQLNSQQIQLIKDTAASICNTVIEAKGQKSDLQIQGDVKAQLGGLVGKVVDVGGSGKGSLTREEFEGLSREATATAMEGDRGCRERVFNKMFDKLTISSSSSLQPTEPSPMVVDTKSAAQWRDFLKPYTFIDAVSCPPDIFVLAKVFVDGDAYQDPHSDQFPVAVVSVLKLNSSSSDRATVTTVRVGHGTLDCAGDDLKIFVSYKLKNGTYDMGGTIYTRRKADLVDVGANVEFSSGNYGWFPELTDGKLKYFSSDGYRRMIDNTDAGPISPQAAEDDYNIYRIHHSNGILPNPHDYAVEKIIGQILRQPNTSEVSRY